MCFPAEFSFPPSLSRNQCYQAMGISLNVHVVAILMTYLFHDVSIFIDHVKRVAVYLVTRDMIPVCMLSI